MNIVEFRVRRKQYKESGCSNSLTVYMLDNLHRDSTKL